MFQAGKLLIKTPITKPSGHPSRLFLGRCCVLGFLLAMTLGAALLRAAELPVTSPRNYDARTHQAPSRALAPKGVSKAIESFRRQVPELTVGLSELTALPRSLTSRIGFLTEPAVGEPGDLALEFVRDHLALLGLATQDLAGSEVKDVVYSRPSGATRLYLQQKFDGLPVYNGLLHITVNRDGQILSLHNAFVGDIARRRLPTSSTGTITSTT